MRTKLPIVSLIGTYGGKVLGSLSKLEINDCSSSGVIDIFGRGTGFLVAVEVTELILVLEH